MPPNRLDDAGFEIERGEQHKRRWTLLDVPPHLGEHRLRKAPQRGHPSPERLLEVELAGDELSMTELAQAFSQSTGKDVRYMQVPWDQFKQQAGSELTTMYHWFEDVGYHVDIAALRREHPGLASFDSWLNANWEKA